MQAQLIERFGHDIISPLVFHLHYLHAVVGYHFGGPENGCILLAQELVKVEGRFVCLCLDLALCGFGLWCRCR